jgi:hypothetical protein
MLMDTVPPEVGPSSPACAGGDVIAKAMTKNALGRSTNLPKLTSRSKGTDLTRPVSGHLRIAPKWRKQRMSIRSDARIKSLNSFPAKAEVLEQDSSRTTGKNAPALEQYKPSSDQSSLPDLRVLASTRN